MREVGVADTVDIIKTIRACRGGCVQNTTQAQFVFESLQAYASIYGSVNEDAVLQDSIDAASGLT